MSLPEEIKEMVTISNKKYWQSKFLFAEEFLNNFAEIFTYWNPQKVIPFEYSTRVQDMHLYPLKREVQVKNIIQSAFESQV